MISIEISTQAVGLKMHKTCIVSGFQHSPELDEKTALPNLPGTRQSMSVQDEKKKRDEARLETPERSISTPSRCLRRSDRCKCTRRSRARN